MSIDPESPAATIYFDASCELGVPVRDLFTFIADHEGLPQWVPGLKRVTVDDSQADRPGGAGARRVLHGWLGPPGTEVVLVREAPLRLVYSATDASLRGFGTAHRAELTCEPTPVGTRLTWIVHLNPPKRWWRRVAARLMFQAGPRACLRRLKRLFPATARCLPPNSTLG